MTGPTPPRPGLAAVIPVRDDAANLARLLAGIADLGIFDQVVVVDDGSEPPLGPDLMPPGTPEGWLRLIRCARSGGAGRARNIGLAQVTTTHLICLDADDAVTAELAALWTEIRDLDFDFCLFGHADSRVAGHGLWGLTAFDRGLWIAAGLDRARLAAVGPQAAAHLVQTAAYPWNKIYRAGFLDTHGIRCAVTLVHNDIPLHWDGFLAARTILASNRIGVWHHVGASGRLTAQQGAARLELFATLGRIAARIAPDSPWFQPFVAFASRLFDWTVTRLDGAHRETFLARRRAFLADLLLPPAAFAALARTRPLVARRVIRQLGP